MGGLCVCVYVLCVYLNMYIRRGGLSGQKNGRLCRPRSPALLNFRIFTREAKGGGGVNYRYISSTRSAHRREAKKNNVPKKVKKKKNSMTVPWQIAGGDLFSYLGMGRRMNGNDVINLSNCSESLLLLLFLAFSHTKSLIGCWNSRVP